MTRIWTVLVLYFINLPFADDMFVVVLTLPMFALVMVGMIRLRSRYFEIGDIFWFCLFIYFVVSPLQRIHGDRIGGATAITAYAYEADEYVMAMLVACVFVFPFVFVQMQREEGTSTEPGARPSMPMIVLSNAFAFVLFVLSQGGIDRLLSSRLEQDGSQGFIASMLFLGMQSVTACLAIARFRLSPHRLLSVISICVVLLFLAVARNPFNAPRFELLAVWGPVLLAFSGGKVPASRFYACCLIVLTFVFPILNVTTRSGIGGLQDLAGISMMENFFDIPSVDVFDTAVHSVRFMSTHDHMWGEKLAAVILFFVPRSIWPGKPVVGGLDIGNELFAAGMYGTPNLSFFLGYDFYMDCGFAGVLVGGVAAAFVLNAAIRARLGIFFQLRVLHFVIASSLPILLRGPVGAVLPLFVCQVFLILLFSMPWWRRNAGTGPVDAMPFRRGS
ncbi:hypothetical protein [Rhizobium sp. Root1220]|uniref:hypothetical protein n=1 Tax=Rhizobium sp. Root1220 TaxID=1736432 RepID=UPI0006F6C07C|nr:hypothetical protein [Rhizobium sp. Root1220]KQV83778.1 hypothetical protein ASC90_19125 [Rhizobium sp. Root1220]